MNLPAAVYWAQQLLRCPSVTPQEAGCYALVRQALGEHGFRFQDFECAGVPSLWAQRGEGAVDLCLSAHVDVVPVGERSAWSFDPFSGDVVDGLLRGRGSVDMKGALGAMLDALIATASSGKRLPNLALLLSASEEGPSEHGTGYALQQLRQQGQNITMALVGEPTSVHQLGDYYKIGRRGSLSLELGVIGKQGHVAYPEQALNPIHQSLELLQHLRGQSWGAADADFAAGSMQVVGADCANAAFNVVPNSVNWRMNWRYPASISSAQIMQRVQQVIVERGLDCQCQWHDGAQAFLSQSQRLAPLVQRVSAAQCGSSAQPSTNGGTSDARFFAAEGIEVVELGARNTGAHQVDESAPIADIVGLSNIYQQIIYELGE